MKKLLKIAAPGILLFLIVTFVRSAWFPSQITGELSQVGLAMALGDFLLFVTAISTAYAMYFTYHLLRSAQDARDDVYMPMLIAYDHSELFPEVDRHVKAHDNNQTPSHLNLRVRVGNAGKGIALSVTVDPVQAGYFEKIAFKREPYITQEPQHIPGDSRLSRHLEAKETEASKRNHGFPKELTVRCKDIAGNSYSFVHDVLENGQLSYSHYHKYSKHL